MVLVVAANSRGRCSAFVSLPNSEFVPLGPGAAVVRVAHKVQKGRRSTAPWSMLTKTRREVNADGTDDGSNGTEASSFVDVPPDRL